MKKIDFTSGEKRGLILLLIILLLLVGLVFLMNNFGRKREISVNTVETIDRSEIDSAKPKAGNKDKDKDKNTRQKKIKEKPKDGAKRNYRDEYID